MKFVEIEWADAGSNGGWREGDNYPKDSIQCRTAGYLLHKDSEAVTVAQSISRDGAHADRMTIPMGCVRKYRVIRRNAWGKK